MGIFSSTGGHGPHDNQMVYMGTTWQGIPHFCGVLGPYGQYISTFWGFQCTGVMGHIRGTWGMGSQGLLEP